MSARDEERRNDKGPDHKHRRNAVSSSHDAPRSQPGECRLGKTRNCSFDNRCHPDPERVRGRLLR